MSHIHPIGGGKGGTGKSFLATNMGVVLAKQGKKVVVVDLDLGGSNLHTFLGVGTPRTGLDEFLNMTYRSLGEVAVPTLVPNLFLISSANCSLEIANLFYAQKLKIIRAIQKLPYDHILLDLGSGTNFNTIDFFLTSNEGLFIFTPEPTSIENTARFIRAVYLRKAKHILKQRDFNAIVKDIIHNSEGTTIRAIEIIESLMETRPEKGRLLEDRLSKFRFSLILNRFQKNTDESLGEKIEKVCNRHFSSEFQFLGNISYDERVYDSILAGKAYVNKYPYTETALDLKRIVDRLTDSDRTHIDDHHEYHEKI